MVKNIAEIDHAHSQAEAVGGMVDFPVLRLILQGTGYVVELNRPEAVLGRHTRCDVRLPLPDVSRCHCAFTYQKGAWSVKDLQSKNGVFVNGTRVTESLLKDCDLLGIGGFKFEVQIAESQPDMPPKPRAPMGANDIVSLPNAPSSPRSGRRKAS